METKTDTEKLAEYSRLKKEYLNLSTLGYWTDARLKVEGMILNNCQDEALPELKRLLAEAQEREAFGNRSAFWRGIVAKWHGRTPHQKNRFFGEAS